METNLNTKYFAKYIRIFRMNPHYFSKFFNKVIY